jgi:hypothetical protein
MKSRVKISLLFGNPVVKIEKLGYIFLVNNNDFIEVCSGSDSRKHLIIHKFGLKFTIKPKENKKL